MSKNSMNYKVGPLTGEELSGLNLLSNYYGMKPAAIFRTALAMFFMATQKEIERAKELDDDNNADGVRPDTTAVSGDTESPPGE
jgi:hypothetical protein